MKWILLFVLALLLVGPHPVAADKDEKKKRNKKAKKKQKKETNTQQQTDVGASYEEFIINGVPTLPNQYPFFTQMFWDNKPVGCGASLIADRWILTAAHCVYRFFDNGRYLDGYPHWKVGSYCRRGESDAPNCGARESYRHTKLIHPHPQYGPDILKWDYALVELDAPVDEIPVTIDDGTITQTMKSRDPVQSIGTGWKKDSRKTPKFLQEVTNLFLPNCPFTHESILCTNGRNFGTCRGDSGSPSMVRNDAARAGWVQVGVTSFGRVPCENHNSPDGYARVATAFSWIVDVICPTYAEEGQADHVPTYAEEGQADHVPEFCLPKPAETESPTPSPSRRPSLRPTSGPSKTPTLGQSSNTTVASLGLLDDLPPPMP